MYCITRRIHFRLMTILQSIHDGCRVLTESMRRIREHGHDYKLLEGIYENHFVYSSLRKRHHIIKGLAVAVILLLCFFFSALPTTSRQRLGYHDPRLCYHPIVRLASEAAMTFNNTLKRQSKSLDEAVTEYRRRYEMPPPPHFDKWYEFAKERDTVLIDEFDTIYHSLLPFWGILPSTIRLRVREDLGSTYNKLMGISIRSGRPIYLGNGQGDFQENATIKQLEKFSQWLPDMDLEFNAHDEPRVAVPHDELQELITKSQAAQSRLNKSRSLSNNYSQIEIESPIPESFKSRFIDLEQQETWLYSRLSCPLDSPARSLDGNAPDNTSAFAMQPLGFVYNQTAFSDICNSPSLRHQLGIFEYPNALKITNELGPIFSMSRPSLFQDIPVPSPYYYEGCSDFDTESAMDWESKKGQLYWRGGTTGGVSLGGSWRNLQRQRVIGRLTYDSPPRYLLERNENSTFPIHGEEEWTLRQEKDTELSDYFNAHFVDIVNCGEDCDDEKEYFNTVDRDEPTEAWKYKCLLDMDGHAYSGRFYSFMRSKSVPLKLTYFREWHENILIPWVHYVPLNKDGDEIPEIIRFFEQDPVGQEIARDIGEGGQLWANKAIRNDDMDVYMFRLMLYARVQDDQRENLGFRFRGS
ncbi:Lipopolysaccharide-modifying protein [Penicillium herquei]|nr:Lipopolysaccharide-modifying protein [Penicillium herquei]